MAIGATGSPISGTASYIQTANRADILRTMSAESIAKLWSNVVTYGEKNAMVWEKHTGMEGDSPIWSGRQLSAGRGHTIYFKSASPFGKAPTRGETLFLDSEQFERDHLLAYPLTVERTRFAYSVSDHMEPAMGMVGELTGNTAQLLGERWGRQRDEDIDMMFLLKIPAQNVMFARGRTGFAGLKITDTFRHEDVTALRYAMGRVGRPCKIKKDKAGNAVKSYLIHSPSDGLYGLRTDLINNGILTGADERGGGNAIFGGGFLPLDGQIIEERCVIDESTQGPWGSPLTPRASLGRSMSDGVTGSGVGPAAADATELWGGHNVEWTKEQYYQPMRWFPGWNYDWGYSLAQHSYAGATADTPGKAPLYVIAYNVGGTDKGKWGMYRYTAIESTHARYLTCDRYLRSSNGGQQSRGYTTVGNVQWDSAKNTTTHTAGLTMLIPCTENGVPFCYHLALGAGAAMFAYGETRNKRETERFNGQVTRTFLANVAGQALRYDAAYRVPAAMVCVAAIEYPDMPINPTLVS